ncbi:hypothetical protein D3C76_1303080 [compost metagenome]
MTQCIVDQIICQTHQLFGMKPVKAVCADNRSKINLSTLGESPVTSKQHIEELFSFHLNHGHLQFTGTQRRIHLKFTNHLFHPLHISEQHILIFLPFKAFQLTITVKYFRIGTNGHQRCFQIMG